MEKRRPLIQQEELLKAQEEAKKKKLGIWGASKSSGKQFLFLLVL